MNENFWLELFRWNSLIPRINLIGTLVHKAFTIRAFFHYFYFLRFYILHLNRSILKKFIV